MGNEVIRSRGCKMAPNAINPTQKAPDIVWLLGMFVLLAAMKAPFILEQLHPHLYFDEAFYLYKARIFFDHLQWAYPDFVEDGRFGLYKPLYSVLISPSGFFSDPSVGYRCALFINSLLLSSGIFPVYSIAKRTCFSKRWIITFLVGFWSVHFAYSLSVMSEALFIPLITWIAFFYMKYMERPALHHSMAVGVALAAAVMTKNAGVALIPALVLVTPFHLNDGSVRIASFSEILRRLPMSAIAVCAWCLWEATHGSVSKQSVSSYTHGGLFQIVQSMDNLAMYGKIWLGQIAYLNLSTCFLILLLPLSCFKLGAGEREKGSRPLVFFLLLLAFFALLPGTVHMIKLKLAGSPDLRYDMYGRYADMLLPLVLIYGLGNAYALDPKTLFSPRRVKRALAFMALFVLFILIVFLFAPQPVGIRVMNTGAAWLHHLSYDAPPYPGRTVFFISLVVCLVFFFKLLPIGKRKGDIALTIVLLASQVANSYLIHEKIQQELTRSNGRYYDRFSDIRRNGDALYYSYVTRYFYPGVYYFYTDFENIDSVEEIQPEKTWVMHKNRIMPYTLFMIKRGYEIVFSDRGNSDGCVGYGWGIQEINHRWSVGKEAALHVEIGNGESNHLLEARLFPHLKPGVVDRQRVFVHVNGHKIAEWSVDKKDVYNATVPADFIDDRLDIRFELPDAASPRELGEGDDVRALAIGMTSFSIREIEAFEIGSMIKFGERQNANEYLGNGWGEPFGIFRWTVGNEADLFLQTGKTASDLLLTARLFPHARPGVLDAQRVRVFVNDRKIEEWVVDKKGEYEAIIPRERIDGYIHLRFDLPDAISALDLGLGEDGRKLAVGMIALSISHAEED